MKVTKKFIKSFKQYNFEILGQTEVHKTIKHYIPYSTEWNIKTGGFPSYLAGFESYYEYESIHNKWKLKEEYLNNRPKYSVEITYFEYEVKLNEDVKKEIKRRYEYYSKIANKYEKLLELI